MAARVTIENGEIIKNSPIQAGSREIARLTVKTSNYAGKESNGSPKFEDVWLMVTCFSPSEEIKRLSNGDRVNIGMPQIDDEGEVNNRTMASLRLDSNPNVYQIHKSILNKTTYSEDELKPSRFPEVLCFANQITLREKADTTRSTRKTNKKEYPITDHDDDFPY